MEGMVTIVITQATEDDDVSVQTYFAPSIKEGVAGPATHGYALKMLEAVATEHTVSDRGVNPNAEVNP